METQSAVRVRFAPSPTGLMHLGNVRTALLNYLFARHNKGAFILRVEDTDAKRNYDPGAETIKSDLAWLHLQYDEGPDIGGPYAPYYQSQRQDLYQKCLKELIETGHVYRCFCSADELEKKRARQLALRKPPRYDRACLKLASKAIVTNLEAKTPFIWRFKLDNKKTITIHDLARGHVSFELSHYSDIPVTRNDGSFTFLFANCVDDIAMKVSHVFRGEDHLSNTAGQAALYEAFSAPLPKFWHMPILCNIDGKKLSKRDFGFSLKELMNAGYLPQAICNYLAVIGGGSFKQEIMDLDELAQTLDLSTSASSGQVKYDVEKLNWINHKWIEKLDTSEVTQLIRPFLESVYPQANAIIKAKLMQLAAFAQKELYTLQDSVRLLGFYFEPPSDGLEKAKKALPEKDFALLSKKHLLICEYANASETFEQKLKELCSGNNIPIKHGYWFVRLMLMGNKQGPSIRELVSILGKEEVQKRFNC